MEKNQEFTVSIEDMSEDGAGIGKLDGYIWFIKDAVIGDVVRARAMKMKKKLRICKADGDSYSICSTGGAKVSCCPSVRRLSASGHVL